MARKPSARQVKVNKILHQAALSNYLECAYDAREAYDKALSDLEDCMGCACEDLDIDSDTLVILDSETLQGLIDLWKARQ